MALQAASEDGMIPNQLFSGSGAAKSSFACEQCKKKKIKCDKETPRCGHCTKLERGCDYPVSVPKPGPKVGSVRKRRSLSPESQDRQVRRREHSSDGSTEDEGARRRYIGALLHPNHEGPRIQALSYILRDNSPAETNAFVEALSLLGITEDQYHKIASAYFANMTSFTLFHRPTFDQKVKSIQVEKEIRALILSIGVFSQHFGETGLKFAHADGSLWKTAKRLVLECLEDCEDGPPPLHILQALVLIAWQKVYQGVRGVAWRLVGECVRVAYELQLNKEPEGEESNQEWIAREEGRRAWWACWELDVFSSTIKQLPLSIDRHSISTLLPALDDLWFNGVRGKSCPLNLDPNNRWKDLEKTGNANWTAWFILINSYKYDAYLLSADLASSTKHRKREDSIRPANTNESIDKRRDVLLNCLHSAQMALPEKLVVQDVFLSFQPAERVTDAGRYAIHLVAQVTRFMLYRLDIFRTLPSRKREGYEEAGQPASTARTFREQKYQRRWGSNGLAWEHFLASAQEATTLIRNSARDHVHFVNPCLSNALWFAASALIVGRILGPRPSDRQWMTSNFDLLWATLRQYIKIWDVPATLIDRFDSLEEQIAQLGSSGGSSGGGGGGIAFTTKVSSADSGGKQRARAATAGAPQPVTETSAGTGGAPDDGAVTGPAASVAQTPASLQLSPRLETGQPSILTPAASDRDPSGGEMTPGAGGQDVQIAIDDAALDFLRDQDINSFFELGNELGFDLNSSWCPFE